MIYCSMNFPVFVIWIRVPFWRPYTVQDSKEDDFNKDVQELLLRQEGLKHFWSQDQRHNIQK